VPTVASILTVLAMAASFIMWRRSMSAALTRLNTSVDAAVARLAEIPTDNDAALNAAADKLDAAVAASQQTDQDQPQG
jgi:hypothetical protein